MHEEYIWNIQQITNMDLTINTHKFKDAPLKARFRLKLPQYPPQPVIIILLAVNLLMAFLSNNPTLYQLFIYIYGSLMLFEAHIISFHLKVTMLANLFVGWCNIQGRPISFQEEKIVYGAMALLYGRVLGYAIYEVLKSLVFMIPVRFEHVFWTLQLGVFCDFLHHFTGVKTLRLVPNILRIFQNMQVMSVKSLTGSLRFSLKILQHFFIPYTWQWLALKIIIGIWDTYNDFSKQFVVSRVFNDKTCIYPKSVIVGLFVIDFLMIWSWPLDSSSAKSTCKVIRRVCWNYVKLESRTAETPGKHVLLHIIQYYTNKQLDDICL